MPGRGIIGFYSVKDKKHTAALMAGGKELMHAVIGENIKRVRKEKGLKTEYVAARAGISRPYFTRIENGRKNIEVYILSRIAAALGVGINDLLRD